MRKYNISEVRNVGPNERSRDREASGHHPPVVEFQDKRYYPLAH